MAKIIWERESHLWKDRQSGYAEFLVEFSCGHTGKLWGTRKEVKADKSKCQRCIERAADEKNKEASNGQPV
jgi:hypothetical protein